MTEAQLKVLLAVVDAGSFSLAGQRLTMSQPGVSRAVASLEEELGVELLTRRRGAVTLTNVGVQVAVHARGVLSHAEAIRQHAGRVSRAYPGRLRIGSLPGLSARLAPVLARLHAHDPGVEIEIREATDDTVLSWIRTQSVDVGLVARPAADLDIVHLYDVALVAVLPAEHPVSELDAVPLSALESERFVLARSGFERLVADAFAADGRTVRVGFEVSDVRSAIGIVAAGLGVAIAPDLLLDDLPRGVVVLPLEPALVAPLGLAVKSRAEALPAAGALLAAASTAFDLTTRKRDRPATAGLLASRRPDANRRSLHHESDL